MPRIRWYASGLVIAFIIFFALGGFDIWHTLNSAATEASAIIAAVLSCLKFAQESLRGRADPGAEFHTLKRDTQPEPKGFWQRVW